MTGKVLFYMRLQDENQDDDGAGGSGDLPLDPMDEVDGDGDEAFEEAASSAAAFRVFLTGVGDEGRFTFFTTFGFFADESTTSDFFRFWAEDATVGAAFGVDFAFVVLRVGVRDRDRGRDEVGVDFGDFADFGDLTVTLRAGVRGVAADFDVDAGFFADDVDAGFFADRAGVLAIA